MSQSSLSETFTFNLTEGLNEIILNESIVLNQGKMIVWKTNNGAQLMIDPDWNPDYIILQNQSLIPIYFMFFGFKLAARISIKPITRPYFFSYSKLLSQSFPYPGTYTVTVRLDDFNKSFTWPIVVVDGK